MFAPFETAGNLMKVESRKKAASQGKAGNCRKLSISSPKLTIIKMLLILRALTKFALCIEEDVRVQAKLFLKLVLEFTAIPI